MVQAGHEIDKGIPSEHFTRVVRADPNRKGILYAGTETGMYVSFNDGLSLGSFPTKFTHSTNHRFSR